MIKNIKNNYHAYIVIICGLLGVFAAFTLLLNRIEYFKNPNFVPPCSVNIWLDCGVVMKSKWASLYNFPNTMIGLVSYPLAVMTGLMMLMNKENNRYLMLINNFIAFLGMITNIVLLYISSYLIASLCPWCLLAGVATSNIFFSILFYNIKHDNIILKNQDKAKARIRGGWDLIPVLVYYVIMFLFVWLAFFLREIQVDTTQFLDPIFWLWGQK
jgi:uncharacterized membrane protein